MCSLLLLQLAGQITAGRRKEFKKKKKEARGKAYSSTTVKHCIGKYQMAQNFEGLRKKNKGRQEFQGAAALCGGY